MDTICHACGYQRKPTDQAPDWEYPSCGRAYVKTSQDSSTSHEMFASSVRLDQSEAPVSHQKASQYSQTNDTPSEAAQSEMGDRESVYSAHGCADYLNKFYPHPHTYQNSVITRIIIPILIVIALSVVLVGVELDLIYSGRHHPNSGQHTGFEIIFGVFCIAASLWFLSFSWRKTVIDRHSITITLSLSKTTIAANDVLGYVIDVIPQPRGGPPRTQFSLIQQVKGHLNERRTLSINKSDLSDPKLRGLFAVMKNYGNVRPADVADDAGIDQNSGTEILYFMLFVALVLIVFWVFFPGIRLDLERLHALSGAGN